MKRIISLTSIPPRFPFLKKSLETLLSQESVDEVRLYIPKKYRRFPLYDGVLPDVPKGVTLCIVDEDFGPATKILPACKDFRGENVQILFCDDDAVFPKGWAKKLFDIQENRSIEAVAVWGRPIGDYISNEVVSFHGRYAKQIKIQHDIQYRLGRVLEKLFGYIPLKKPMIVSGYVDVFFGVCGVVVKPIFFDSEAFDIPNEAWAVDDIWLSAYLAKKNIPIYSPWRLSCPHSSESANVESLLTLEVEGKKRQELNAKAAAYCQNKYKIWK